jgi:hypothetical protein
MEGCRPVWSASEQEQVAGSGVDNYGTKNRQSVHKRSLLVGNYIRIHYGTNEARTMKLNSFLMQRSFILICIIINYQKIHIE